MARATGIGGVFFRSHDPGALQAWYTEHLGLQPSDDGVIVIRWGQQHVGSTVWAPFPADTDYFGDASQQWMINYRVDDLDAVLAELKSKGVEVADDTHEMEGLGRFGWAVDPEGNRFEMWEPAEGC